MLKFPIKDITSAGLNVSQDVELSEIGLSQQEVDVRSPLSVNAVLTRVDNTVIADVTVNAEYGYQCARCLEDFARQKSRELHFDFEVASPMDVIDVGEEIRQEMILNIPQRVLCSKDCKGICAGCGANLNIEKCKCQ
ncbi:MAG: DUF177 domain-containing protein [Candidatus Omnitrophica bacterium]|nr:DUF177 domain-containing protein [Candidatus Omnitrophota bacterium]